MININQLIVKPDRIKRGFEAVEEKLQELYTDIFHKYTFDIHEFTEHKKLGKLKYFFYAVKSLPNRSVEYKSDLGDKIIIFIDEINPNIGINNFNIGINTIHISSYEIKEVLKLLELENKYY